MQFEDFEYTDLGLEISIDKYKGSATSITIPAQIEGLPVTSIGKGAFNRCRSLESINIPKGITSIGEDAFSWCTNLTSITLPEGLTSIGESAFYSCSSLTSINLPRSLTSIGNWAFNRCRSLESINIPKGVTSIGKGAFWCCTSLKFIKIPDSVNRIGNKLFKGCDHLKWVYIKKSWKDKAINNIFGDNPPHKIFRTVSKVKLHLQETLSELNIGILFSYMNEIKVLEDSLRSRDTADDTIMDIVAPAVNDLENLAELQKREDYFRRVINLINAVSSEKLTNASDCLQELNSAIHFIEYDLKTNVIALLMLENKLFMKERLPNPDLSVVKEAAQVLSRLEIYF